MKLSPSCRKLSNSINRFRVCLSLIFFSTFIVLASAHASEDCAAGEVSLCDVSGNCACHADSDGDGVPNSQDSCPDIFNPSQADYDGDGTGDACEVDMDGDGIGDENDNCPGAANVDQADGDGDGIGDACDETPDSDDSDYDDDGIPNDVDNCTYVSNPSQSDIDNDDWGDECDEDKDGDGVENELDNCPMAANPGQEDSDSDGIGDACGEDCLGVPGGTAEIDDCGVCDGNNQDKDSCGVCSGDNSSCNQCQAFKIKTKYLGDWGLADPMFVGTDNTPSCVAPLIEKAIKACRSNYVAKKWPNFFDDCVVGGYFLREENLIKWNGYPQGPWTPTSRQTFKWGANLEGTFYVDNSCQSLDSAPPDYCNAGYFQWRGSPISLLWKKGIDVDADVTLSRFPLNPAKNDSWTVWKASENAPLLVFDPEHKGQIFSAAQLFGDWTFGGKRTASLGAVNPSQSKWRDGFEALATLDSNGDGKISAEELAPLGLWFDKNRDGISQPGEVKTLAEVDVTTLYYQADGKNSTTGTIVASKGYERTVANKIVVGTSVDWYGEGGDSQYELIAKLTSKSALCNQDSGDKDLMAMARKAAAKETFQQESQEQPLALSSSKRQNVRGIWKWKAVDERMKNENAPQGYLTFADAGDGKIKGHSISEIQFQKHYPHASGMVNIYPVAGLKKVDASGNVTIQFELDSEDPLITVSEATLSRGGNRLEGVTSAQMQFEKQPVKVTYRWVAERIAFNAGTE